MLKYLRGTRQIELTGADPEAALNAMTRDGIAFWELSRLDAFCLRCRIYEADWAAVQRSVGRRQCEAKTLRRFGLRYDCRWMRKRPVLVAMVVLSTALALWLQNYMWFFRVEGAESVDPEQILRQLEEEGVYFGAWGPGLDTEMIKNRMLLRNPKLKWIGVNRDGAVVHVLLSERVPEQQSDDRTGVCNIVAERPGIITLVHTYNGFAQVAPGDAVEEGELLVSGVTDLETCTQVTHAEAEVYAKTLRMLDVRTPEQYGLKFYTGRSEECKTIIFQTFRRNLSGNSSNFGTMCDKIIKIQQVCLPGGYRLPIYLETTTLLEYRIEPAALSDEQAETILRQGAERLGRAMIFAGEIERQTLSVAHADGAFEGRSHLFCQELISRSVPVELFGEGETYGGEENGEDH